MLQNVILLIPATFSLTFLLQALFSKGFGVAKVPAVAFHSCCFLTLLMWGLFCNGLADGVVEDLISMFAALSIAPCYFLYMDARMGIRNRRIYKFLLFLPAILVFVSNLVIFIIMGFEEGEAAIQYAKHSPIVGQDVPTIWRVRYVFGSTLFHVMFALTTISIFGSTLTNFHNTFKKYRSLPDQPEIRSIRKNLLWSTVVTFLVIVVCIIYASLDVSDYINRPLIVTLLALIMSLPLLALGIMMISGNSAFKNFSLQNNAADISTARANTETMAKLQLSLERFMNEKGFCDPELNLTTLSEKLETNRTYLSELVNQKYGMSFSEFLAEHRIRHAIQLMKEGGRSMKSIAVDSGYTSMSTFYRNLNAFKQKIEGE